MELGYMTFKTEESTK